MATTKKSQRVIDTLAALNEYINGKNEVLAKYQKESQQDGPNKRSASSMASKLGKELKAIKTIAYIIENGITDKACDKALAVIGYQECPFEIGDSVLAYLQESNTSLDATQKLAAKFGIKVDMNANRFVKA